MGAKGEKLGRERRIEVYPLPDQKKQLEALAAKAGRKLGPYLIMRGLNAGFEDSGWKERAEKAEADALRWREDYWKLNAELTDSRRIIRNLEDQVQESQRLLNQARTQMGEMGSEVEMLDARILQLLVAARADEGIQLPVLERDLVNELDITTKPAMIEILQKRLEELAQIAVIRKQDLRGKPAWVWNEEASL